MLQSFRKKTDLIFVKPWVQQYGGAILLMVCLGGLGAYLIQRRHLGQADERAVLVMEELKDQVQAAFQNADATTLTLRLNSNRFACLAEGGEGCQGKSGLFIFYGLDGKSPLPLSQIGEDKGMTLDKVGCSGFPSAECPIRVEASWRPVNAGASCDPQHPVQMQVRVIVNNGGIFLDWKTERLTKLPVPLSARALCQCEGKTYAAGACRSDGSGGDLTAQESNGRDLADERRDEREELAERERQDARAETQGENQVPDCPPVIRFRNEEFAVVEVGASGDAQIQLEGEDQRCSSLDTYRFQCAAKQDKNKIVADWIFMGVDKGVCPELPAITTTADAATPPAEGAPDGAAEGEAGRAPATVDIRQGFVSEETQQ